MKRDKEKNVVFFATSSLFCCEEEMTNTVWSIELSNIMGKNHLHDCQKIH